MNLKMKYTSEQNLEFIIRPHSGLFDLKLGELWRYRDLVALFVQRDFVAQFKQTILGPAWFVIQPLLTTIMFTIVFGNIAKLSTDGLPPMLFYMSGNILWQYFANCLTETSNTFITNANIFGKVYFPRLAVPVSITISQMLRFILQFGLFLAFFIYFVSTGSKVKMTQIALLLPVLLLLMVGMSLGLGIIFSSMTTKYRDLRFLLQFGVQLLMYGTPVIYPLSSIEGKWKFLILANPMSPIIETFRAGFLGTGSFSWTYLGYSVGFTVVILFLGIILFTHIERTFMDTV
jgi:lipopolysaccharide transport system permease protein